MNDTALDKMYVEPKERVLDPSLNQSLIERMQVQRAPRLLILPYRGKGKTEGGVIPSDKVIEDNQISTQVGLYLKWVLWRTKTQKSFLLDLGVQKKTGMMLHVMQGQGLK